MKRTRLRMHKYAHAAHSARSMGTDEHDNGFVASRPAFRHRYPPPDRPDRSELAETRSNWISPPSLSEMATLLLTHGHVVVWLCWGYCPLASVQTSVFTRQRASLFQRSDSLIYTTPSTGRPRRPVAPVINPALSNVVGHMNILWKGPDRCMRENLLIPIIRVTRVMIDKRRQTPTERRQGRARACAHLIHRFTGPFVLFAATSGLSLTRQSQRISDQTRNVQC